MTEFSVSVEPTDEGTRVVPRGALDTAVAARLRAPLVDAAERGDVELDLAGVPFVDSAGLTVLVVANAAAQRHGHRLLVRGVGPRVMRLLLITELHRALDVEAAPPGPDAEQQ